MVSRAKFAEGDPTHRGLPRHFQRKSPGINTGAICLEWAFLVGLKAFGRWNGRGNGGSLSLDGKLLLRLAMCLNQGLLGGDKGVGGGV